MRQFEDERREYANQVHYLVIKKKTLATKKPKNEAKTGGRLESNKIDLQPKKE